MSDIDTRTVRQPASQDLGDRLKQAGEEAKTTASDVLASASETARDKLDELGAAAKDTAAQAADRVKSEVGAQQEAGADYAQRLAGNIRNAAHAFENDTPFAARTIETAADYIEDAAAKIRNGSLSDVVDGMTSFAKRQPAAFLGLSVLAGFAAIRFLKASSAGTSSSADGSFGDRRSS
jgi:hypothetical protein